MHFSAECFILRVDYKGRSSYFYNNSSQHQAMKIFVLLAFILANAIQSFSWGVTGHRATGYIAQQYLSAKAKRKMKALLGQESLALASTWMDEIRSDSTYNYTADWHWVTIENGEQYENAVKNPNGDVIATLERLISDLKAGKLDRKKEMEALKMIIHLVGDIHQPLHVGCCNDQGGNKVKVKWFRSESNLHRVWDSEMIDDTKLSYTELAQALPLPDKATAMRWQKASVREWARESMSYRPQVYDIGSGNLGYRYSYQYFDIVKHRLVQAGIRLAGVLNEIYG